MTHRLFDAFLVAATGFLLMLPLVGIKTSDGLGGASLEWRWGMLLGLTAVLFVGRLGAIFLYSFARSKQSKTQLVADFLPAPNRGWGQNMAGDKGFYHILLLLGICALIFPMTPFASRYVLDVMIMILTYIVLAAGLNIVIGYAGLLDLGYAGFYAIGAYGYALLALHFGLGFWGALPVVAGVAALAALVLGLPVLRLRGDYFALVTLGFGEIVRLVLINWTELAGGPNGISGIPRPTLFGMEFVREAGTGGQAFHDVFGVPFDPGHRVIFLYFIILLMATVVVTLGVRLRRSTLGRAWEAFRENEVAVASVGISRWRIKLAAYSIGALVAALAGAFFAARQGFISPESFTFTESATILAIVILGGSGHILGIVLAALFVIGVPELFREFEQFRILIFGAGMVAIMLWRPGGLMARREPTILLDNGKR